MLDSVPFTARLRKDITCLRGHIVKLSTQTIHTVCCETPLFFKGKKFKLFNSLFYSVYQSLFSIADLFAVVICDPVRDRHSRRLTCLFMYVLRALATLNQTSELAYSIWARRKYQ